MNDTHHPHLGRRRAPRLARALTALAMFAATTAGLHALSDHYGWPVHHWSGYHHGGWGANAPCDNGTASTPSAPRLPS